MLFVQTSPQQHLPQHLQQNPQSLQSLQHLQEQQQQQQQQPPFSPFFAPSAADLDDLSVASSPSSAQQFSPAAAAAFQQASPLSTFSTIPAASNKTASTAGSSSHHFGSSFGSSDFEFDLKTQHQPDFDYQMLGTADLMMQSDSWLPHNNQLGLGRSLGRISHHRESSLSSLGSTSAGPASPFSQNTSNPHIAVTDAGDAYNTMSSYYEDPSFQLVKPNAAAAAVAAAAAAPGSDASFYHAAANPATAAYAPSDAALPMPAGAYSSILTAHRQKTAGASSGSDRGLLPPPDLSMGSNSRSQPVSVASSIASDSPATPSLDQPDDEIRRRNGEDRPITTTSATSTSTASSAPQTSTTHGPAVAGQENILFPTSSSSPSSLSFPFLFEDDECSLFPPDTAAFNAPPKLDRTMTDVYSDELYSPSFGGGIATSAPSAPSHVAPSPNQHDMFAQRLQAINNQHLSAAANGSPVSSGASRDRSPFRNSSPLALAPSHDFNNPSPTANGMRYGSSNLQQQQRQSQQQPRSAGPDAQVYRSQMARSEDTTGQTISPKDAVLEYREPSSTEGDANNFSLFAQSNPQMSHPYSDPSAVAVAPGPNSFNYMSSQQLQPSLQIPQQYPFIAQHQNASPQVATQQSRHSPASMVRPGTGMSPSARHGHSQPMTSVVTPHRPMAVTADGGTYTCTYHGCTLRFETPALLQKHKREGHRQINTLASRKADSAVAMSLMTSQAGPHRCERINPSTGKPCNTVFSRPYDLTRHEDTIHNARKQKVRCNLCTEEKTFSRADALTRHFRVCHPDVEFPGKHRKRATHN